MYNGSSGRSEEQVAVGSEEEVKKEDPWEELRISIEQEYADGEKKEGSKKEGEEES